jgi:hypothetical protein
VAAQRARLDTVDARLYALKVPKAYLRDLYTLREHALYVRSTLDRPQAS